MCTGGSGYGHTHPGGRTAEPIDAVLERLNDPAVAAAVVTLLDNAEMLSTLVLGVSGIMDRHERANESGPESICDTVGLDNAMKDPDVQKGLGFIAEIARTIGRSL